MRDETAGGTGVPAVEMRGIDKSFPGVLALRSVQFDLYPGEVHALMGENGAGKSTLMKILAGIYTPDSGSFRLRGGREREHRERPRRDRQHDRRRDRTRIAGHRQTGPQAHERGALQDADVLGDGVQ